MAPEPEVLALRALYTSTNGAGWRNATGWSVELRHACGTKPWPHGITCEGGSVVSIYTKNNSLDGTLPTQLGYLTAINRFAALAFDAKLSGTIPTEMAALTKLAGVLSFEHTSISGTIPSSWLSALRTLKYGVYLDYSHISGTIPSEIAGVASGSLFLDSTRVSGTLPSQLASVAALKAFSVSRTPVSGTIPGATIGGLMHVQQLYLEATRLSGSLPTELGALPNLSFVSLTNTALSYPRTAKAQSALDTGMQRCMHNEAVCLGFPPTSCSAFGADYKPVIGSLSECVSCQHVGWVGPLVAAVCVIIVALVAGLVRTLHRHPRGLKRWVATCALYFTHLQGFGSLSDLPLDWPPWIRAALATSGLDAMRIPHSSCLLGTHDAVLYFGFSGIDDAGGSPQGWIYPLAVCASALFLLTGLAAATAIYRWRGHPNTADSLELALSIVFSLPLGVVWQSAWTILQLTVAAPGSSAPLHRLSQDVDYVHSLRDQALGAARRLDRLAVCGATVLGVLVPLQLFLAVHFYRLVTEYRDACVHSLSAREEELSARAGAASANSSARSFRPDEERLAASAAGDGAQLPADDILQTAPSAPETSPRARHHQQQPATAALLSKSSLRSSDYSQRAAQYTKQLPRSLQRRCLYLTGRYAFWAPRWQVILWVRLALLQGAVAALEALLFHIRSPAGRIACRYVGAWVVVAITIGFTILHMRCRPYALKSQNRLQVALFGVDATLLLLGIAHSALFRLGDTSGPAMARTVVALEWAMAIVLGVGVCGGGLSILFDVRRTTRHLEQTRGTFDELSTYADALIDGPLAERLGDGTIRLVRVQWLLSEDARRYFLPASGALTSPVMVRCQELPDDAFLKPKQAKWQLERGDRSVIALSYGWLTAEHPDPHGVTLAALTKYLQSRLRDFNKANRAGELALFVDFLSLPQKRSQATPRTEREQATFGKGLNVMGSLYASICGTAVVQCKNAAQEAAPPTHGDAGGDMYNRRLYEERGWTQFEEGAAKLVVAHYAELQTLGAALPSGLAGAQQASDKLTEIDKDGVPKPVTVTDGGSRVLFHSGCCAGTQTDGERVLQQTIDAITDRTRTHFTGDKEEEDPRVGTSAALGRKVTDREKVRAMLAELDWVMKTSFEQMMDATLGDEAEEDPRAFSSKHTSAEEQNRWQAAVEMGVLSRPGDDVSHEY